MSVLTKRPLAIGVRLAIGACPLVLSLGLFSAVHAADQSDATTLEQVEVTTAKIPIELRDVAANVTVVTGDELRARGVTDLRTALSLVAGVDIAPGGDGGPASSVPALWGLREFDAFLLVVDGIPSGGAFTPALATLNLSNVERIEVLKGAAPVSYGATSFVGVIHIIHYAAGQGSARIAFGFGSRGSAHAEVAIPLSDASASWRQSILADADKQELKADRADWDRAHLLYRGAGDFGGGQFTLDFDTTVLNQSPNSPHPREGAVLTPRVPLDSNDNPRGAKQDETRNQLALGYNVATGLGDWSTRLAIAHSSAENVKGFLREEFEDDGVTNNADGYSQKVNRTEIYFDTHFATPLNDRATLVWGLDHLYGNGYQRSSNFEYAVLPNGSNAPDYRTLHVDEAVRLDDKRNFTGAYADLEFAVTDAWRIEAGLRFNHTDEDARGLGIDLTGPEPEVFDSGSDSRTENRFSGALGTSFRFWQDGRDYLTAYASYRDAFKPAVVDFGPEPDSDILKPEDAQSTEIGLKGRNADGRLEWDVSLFRMNFRNLVVGQTVNGLPSLINAGHEKFKGAEAEARWNLIEGLSVVGTYAYHDARFGDYVQEFDGVPTQLDGKLLEMSPQHVSSLGLLYAQPQGLRAHVTASYVGKRYYNKRNTRIAQDFTTIDAGIGYAWSQWEVRVDGSNLTDRRDAVAESELGESQFYRMPARTYWLSARYTFASN
ncbi:MAG: TonB-dependent receptor [Dokdonella sp.]